jgi:hypothetical protein
MSRSEERVLIPKQTLTASAVFAEFRSSDRFTALRARLNVTGGTGTSPTLNVYIQNGIPQSDGNENAGDPPNTRTLKWNDLVAFSQVTTSNSEQYALAVGAGNEVDVAKDGALTAGNVANGPIGSIIRAKVVITGTNPSFANCELVIELIP